MWISKTENLFYHLSNLFVRTQLNMKQFILLAITLVAAFIFWLITKPLIIGMANFQAVSVWLWPLILLVILVGMLALFLLLLEARMIWLGVALNLIIFALLFNPKEVIVWGGVAVAFLFQLSAWKIIKKESGNRLHLNLKSILLPGIGRLVTSILILVSFAYFLSSDVQKATQRKELPEVVRKTVQVVVGSYISENSESQNPSLRARATETMLAQITNFLKPYFVFLPPILAFSLFLILQGLRVVFVWLAIFWTLLVFWVLKLLKLVKIEKEEKEAEVIEF